MVAVSAVSVQTVLREGKSHLGASYYYVWPPPSER